MVDAVKDFYDRLTANYHLIFDDWDRSIQHQADTLSAILEGDCGVTRGARVLDCACGIGTQSLALASVGYDVIASDISPAAVERTRAEAEKRHFHVQTYVANLLDLTVIPETDFDAVICLDNALPHLQDDDVIRAAIQVRQKMRTGSYFLGSIRDYDLLVRDRPAVQGPVFYTDASGRRIVHQVWDWKDERAYDFHLYITREVAGDWEAQHYSSSYRAILREELDRLLEASGFQHCRWVLPAESGFYQPIFIAT